MHRVNKPIIILILATLVSSALVACSRTGSGSEVNRGSTVAAAVNGKPIMMSEVERIISQQYQGQQAQMSPLEIAQVRLQVLDNLIQREVLFQRAEKEKLLPSEDEVARFINDQKLQSRMTEDEFQKRLKDMNQTVEGLREEARKQLAIQKLQDNTTGKITISDREVEDFYNHNRQQFVNPRGVALADIVVDPRPNEGLQDDAKSEAEAKQKIELIYAQLRNGADFATVARARSEDPSSLRGGDIGFATEDDLKQNGFPQSLIEQFFGPMEVGSYTQPIQFPNGRWYIFKLTRKQLQSENLTLDSPGVRDQIKEALINQRKQILNAALLEVAMNEAKIENKLAENMLNSPNNLSGPRPAPPTGAASPEASPSVAATPQATASPAANSSPAAPQAQSSPSP